MVLNFRRIFGTSRPREERSSAMVLTVTEDTPADMLAGSMELLVQMPRDHHVQTQRVTVQRSTPMMDLLVQIATAHKLAASSYTLQAIGERGLVLPHQPNTPIGALDALQVKLLPKQGTFLSRKNRQTNQPFETTFRLQVHLPRNQLYVSRVSPKTNLGEILDEVCREKNLDRNKYELRHPANLTETLDLSLSLQDYRLQEVTLCPRQQNRSLGSALSSQDIMALQKQEECRRQQAKQSVFGFMFKKSKESSLSTDSLGNRSVSPARSDETARSNSPIQKSQQQQPPPPPARPLRKRRPAPKPPTQQQQQNNNNLQSQTTTILQTVSKSASESGSTTTTADKDKIVISHSRNSSDSSGYHEASVLSDNPDNGAGRMPETLPRRGRMQGILESPRKLAHTSQASKSLGNLAMATSHGGTLSRGISNTSLSSAGQRKKRAAPPPPMARPLPSAISTQGLERIIDSDESLTSDMELSKPSSDIDVGTIVTGSNSKASSDIACHVHPIAEQPESVIALDSVESARVVKKEQTAPPVARPRKAPKQPQPSTSVESPVASRASLLRSSSPTPSGAESTSFGLPSLTEDEREAIDSIVQAANEFESLKSETSGEVDRRDSECDDVFVEAPLCSVKDASLIMKNEDINEEEDVQEKEAIGVPEAFKDEVVELEHPEVKKVKEDLEIENISATAAVVEKVNTFQEKEELELTNDDLQVSKVEKKDSLVIKDEEKPPTSPIEAKVIVKADHEDNKRDHPIPPESPLDLIKVEDLSFSENAATSTPLQSAKEVKFDVPVDKAPLCAVISTIPKCEHLTDFGVTDQPAQNPEPHNSPKRRGKIMRSQSEMSHFEVGPAERYAVRHLTSNGEAFTFALNPNLGGAANRSIEAAAAAAGKAPTDTDILLQKVSDTLSHSLTPPSPPPTPEDQAPPPSFAQATEPPKGFGSASDKVGKPESGAKQISTVSLSGKESKKPAEDDQQQRGSASNLTLGSQQDTSDYVSASGEDLSIGDWEYQIPAPPSAFRDDDASASVEPKEEDRVPERFIKESISIEAEIHHREIEPPPKPSTLSIEQSSRKLSVEDNQSTTVISSGDSVDFCQPKLQKLASPQLSPEAAELKKAEIISELETKISSQKSIVESVVPRDESYAPKIAPVENNLSNFTITTYTRQKSMDIFEQIDQQQYNDNNRVISTFATLTRGRSIASDYADEKRAGMLKSAQSMERMAAPLVDERANYMMERTEIYREKPVHRSKSYITLTSNEKFQNRANDVDKSRDEKKVDERSDFESKEPSRKFTSLANVNASTNDEIPRHKEKFSQWRENILRKQEEPTKEKQLQSLQVLKSILPQLKNAQATEENSYRSSSENFTTKKRLESQQDQPAKETSPVSSTVTSEVYLRPNRRPQEPAKRYTYGGPPSVSFGSWSERPCVNVQIKTDTDYKFGGSNNNSASGARTIVNLNSAASEANERVQNGSVTSEKKETVREIEKEDEPCIDTTSVNFRELTKTFGKTDAPVRPKPPVAIRTQRHFDFLERTKPEVAPKQNGFADSHVTTTTFGVNHNRTNGPPPPVKRYTSVVGITNNNNVSNKVNNNNTSQTNFRFVNGQSTAPTVKGFVNGQKDFVVPKPPTMPIITGVTLKSVNARPKSSPPMTQADPRDTLLESIRNFGGRGRLRSVNTEKY